MLTFSGLHLFHPNNPNSPGSVFRWPEGALHPVKFASRSFTLVEGRWPTTNQVLFAIKYSLEHFQPYLLGRAVTIITDHANFQWLTSISPQQSKLAR